MADKGIEEKAVQEILKETKRAAARAEVGGPQSWRKPSQEKGVNKRFLNNTVLSTVYNNSKEKKSRGSGLTREDKALFKAAAKFEEKSPVKEPAAGRPVAAGPGPARRGKVVIRTGARYQAYLAAYRRGKEAEKPLPEKPEQPVDLRPQPFYRPVQDSDSE